MQEIPPEDRVTNPIITRYELPRLLACTSEYIYKTHNIHMDPENLYVSTDELDPDTKKNISSDDIYEINDRHYIKLYNTHDIAKVMINKGVAPFIIYREIGRDEAAKIIYVEKWDVNDLIKPILKPLS